MIPSIPPIISFITLFFDLFLDKRHKQLGGKECAVILKQQFVTLHRSSPAGSVNSKKPPIQMDYTCFCEENMTTSRL